MTADDGAGGLPSGQSRPQQLAFVLLLVSVWINYIDRGSLSVAAPVLAPQLSIQPAQMGLLLSAFFWTYSIFQVAGGWLVDRYDVSRVYGLAFLIWSLATLLTGFAGSFATLFCLRLLLGLGESVAYPAYGRILASGFPEHKRGFANSLVDIGTKAGPAVGTFLGGMLIARYGWRVLFWALGAASLLWLGPWFRWTRSSAPQGSGFARSAGSTPPGPSMLEILSRRAAWVTFAALFCFNYAYYVLLTWLPSYLVMEKHFSLRLMAIFGALPFGATAAASLATGWIADRQITAGASPNRVRKGFAVTGLLVSAATLPASAAVGIKLSMTLLVVAFLAIGVFTANVWTMTQTLAGPTAAGKWTGVQNAIGNLGGVAAPVVTGLIVARTGMFLPAFVVAAAGWLIAAALYVFLLGPVAPLVWRAQGATANSVTLEQA